MPISDAQIQIDETGQKATSVDGNFAFNEVPPGTYTLLITRDGFRREVRTGVVVQADRVAEVSVTMSPEYQDMEEFIVQEIEIGGTEQALDVARIESAGLLDGVSSEIISQAGAGDAGEALGLVAGATVQDGKYAVIRGLPDRYVNSQMNAVRLPTADADKRAVELDQFPSDVIESVQVSKTFTPDQQGDASGGAVNVVLKSIPEESSVSFSFGYGFNTNVMKNRDRFLTYRGGGTGYWGVDDGSRDIQHDNIGGPWQGAVGVQRDKAPYEFSWSLAAGGRHELPNGLTLGAFGSFYHERDASYRPNAIDDTYWVKDIDTGIMTPLSQRGAEDSDDQITSLLDVQRASEEIKWGGMGMLGLEIEDHLVSVSYLYTRTTEDTAILAEDTRGKLYNFPDYDRDDPSHPGNRKHSDEAPYWRTETLEYTERTTRTLQFHGEHALPLPVVGFHLPEIGADTLFEILPPEIDWTIARSEATMDQPDKRQFGTQWTAARAHPFLPVVFDAQHDFFKPAANFNMGNLQRIWKNIEEESSQYSINLKFPFRQWTGDEGYLKFGVFHDEVNRTYTQESFTNAESLYALYPTVPTRFVAGWEDFWSEVFPDEGHPVGEQFVDTDYTGEQEIKAWYYMVDVPVCSFLNIIGGVRYESTDLAIVPEPEKEVNWYPSGSITDLRPGDADVDYQQDDVLPSLGFVFRPFDQITIRGSRSETVARQTFKELTPIMQQEFLGGPVFIGNPGLKMSALKNYDLRLDYRPNPTGLVSISWFRKDVTNPIEYVQRVTDFSYTTPINYPEGQLTGWEFEVRQDLGEYWKPLAGLSIGGNATFIESEVRLPKFEQEQFMDPNINAPIETRDMLNAPEHLYNLFVTYNIPDTGTKIGLFYTVRGDTLIAGPGVKDENFIPAVYETEYGTLNFTVSQALGEHWKIKFSAKNLLDPKIQTVYRSEYITEDVVKTSYQKGMSFSLSIGAEW